MFYIPLFNHDRALSKSFDSLFGDCKAGAEDNYQKCIEIFD